MNTPSIYRFLERLPRPAACGLALLLAGCDDPVETVLWSPDGQHGLVRGHETVVVNDAGAIIAKPFPKQDGEPSIGVESWMPDSQRALAVRAVKAKNWSEIAPLLGVERAQAVMRAADEMLRWIKEYRGDWSKFGDSDDPRIKEWMEHMGFVAQYSDFGEGVSLVIAYLRERHAAAIAPLVEAGVADDDAMPRIHELLVRNVLPGAAPAEQILLRSADTLSWARPSPDGRMIAFVRNEPERPALCIVNAQGGEAVQVDTGAAQAAWMPDGLALVYQKTTAPFTAVEQQAQLGTLTRRQVRDAAGAVPAKLADAEDLAGVLYAKAQSRVACLPDGRILFVSCEMSLPAVETARELSLFALQSGATRVITRMVSEAAQPKLPARIDRFSVSPDGRHVALPGSSGEVAVLSLESGEVTEIQGEVANYRETKDYENSASEPAPSWRGASELCYIVPAGHAAGGARRAEVVLQPLGGAPRAISREWSDELSTGFLPRPKK